MTPQEKIARGKRAAEILEDPLVSEALDAMRYHIIDSWQGSALGQRDERETLYFLHCGLKEFESQFRQMMQDGVFAEDAEAKAAAEE